ncbi:MAG: nuclear transport factor 2 family protein [Acidobacteriota bacterium]|jgi:uncharacterized protein (TIGR02246 family)
MSTSHDADVAAIEATVDGFLAAIKVDDLEGILAFYAPDAVIMPPDQASRHGDEAIRAFFRAVLDDFAIEDFDSFPEEVVVIDD